MNTKLFLEIYQYMTMARQIDANEEALASRGEAPFYVPCAGHEGVAAIAPHLLATDWLHCHYRDKALLLARGLTPTSFFHTILGRAEGDSRGRRMAGFPTNRALNIMSGPTVVGNSLLQAVGVAEAVKNEPAKPIVYCAIGDGGTQEGEFFEALAEAVRSKLPVLFLIEDNRLALSTPTKSRTFYSHPNGELKEFYGLPLHRVSGCNPVEVHEKIGQIIANMRENRGPALVIFQVERLTSHTNADDQTIYRTAEEIQHVNEMHDPLKNLASSLVAAGITHQELRLLEKEVSNQVDQALATARKGTEPHPEFSAKKPLAAYLEDSINEYRGLKDSKKYTMIEAVRETLRHYLKTDQRVSLYGEDIEDPKGDVFGITRSLSQQFPGRVVNSPLSEATIMGASVGKALAGKRPVAFIQFADFLPLAYNQLACEAATMWWRTNGAWEAPVITIAVCGAYRPGLDPFHAQTPASVCAHFPGLDVFVPSTGADAAGLLHAAFLSGRPSLFLLSKSLLNDRNYRTSEDVGRQFVPIGKARFCRYGQDLTIVSWGSTMPVCEKVADVLGQSDISVELIDLRSISPWDKKAIISSAEKTGRLLVVHEDNHTCGVGGEILATVAEETKNVRLARVTQADTYIPYHFANQMAVLPNFKTILSKAAELTDMLVTWKHPLEEKVGEKIVYAIGSSPSDEMVTIAQLSLEEGVPVQSGQLLANVEADKAAMEISAPVSGTLEKLHVKVGDKVPVGTPIATIKTAVATTPVLGTTKPEDYGTPVLKPLPKTTQHHLVLQKTSETKIATESPIVLSSIYSTSGSRLVPNDELLKFFPKMDSAYILQRTGVAQRYWIDQGEDVLSLAVKACQTLLEKENIQLAEIDAIICSTGTPLSATPSLACRILKELTPDKSDVSIQAHDVNAACSGYLYAMQTAYDLLAQGKMNNVLVVTAETLSPLLNQEDINTLFLFGDGATASLITRKRRSGNINCLVHRPVLSAQGADEKILYVPFLGTGEHLEMQGQPVFKLAVKKMHQMIEQACAKEGITIEDLALIVPHQANERIIEAVLRTINRSFTFPAEKIFNHIRNYGNTSSNSIPLALTSITDRLPGQSKIGLCAFGGGFTFGAAVIDVL